MPVATAALALLLVERAVMSERAGLSRVPEATVAAFDWCELLVTNEGVRLEVNELESAWSLAVRAEVDVAVIEARARRAVEDAVDVVDVAEAGTMSLVVKLLEVLVDGLTEAELLGRSAVLFLVEEESPEVEGVEGTVDVVAVVDAATAIRCS